ncbi:VanW family protein [Pendulispora albinea]|uniref:VanW family protein n=1 Tax=Pendulispora albinea TaxID=2741071 RepID=UPI00374E0D20
MQLRLPTPKRALLTGGLLVALGIASVPLYRHVLPPGDIVPGLTIDGAALQGEPASFIAARAQALTERKVTLRIGDRTVLETTLGRLGVHVDEGRVLRLARAAGHEGDLLGRAEVAARARRGQLDVPLLASVDVAALSSVVDRIKEREDASPISARLNVAQKTTVPERAGHFIDLDGTLAAVTRLARSPSGPSENPNGNENTLVLPVKNFAPRVTSDFVRTIDVHTVMAEYITSFSRNKDQSRRGQNIDNAANKLDGLVLSPGELISFNDVVGERSEENGFQRSWEIFKGEMVEGVGGGTCQVASTVHAAAFFAGLDIVERLPHSRPSAYIPMGLDATVVYPVVDMKLRNPFHFPIVLQATVDGNRLRVAMLGRSRPATVSFSRDVVQTLPYPRKIEEKPIAGAKVIVKQHGIFGYRIERERILRFRGGKERVEKNKDFYPPTTEIYNVPPGFDLALLPPLPTVSTDEGEGSDTSAQAAASAAAATTGPTPVTTSPQASLVVMEDAPGAHAPSSAQARPVKKVTIRR